MFANVCPKCGKRELVFADQIRSLQPTDHGFAVRYVCSCGALVTWNVEREGVPTSTTTVTADAA